MKQTCMKCGACACDECWEEGKCRLCGCDHREQYEPESETIEEE